MGEGWSYQERQREWVYCLEYGKDLATGSLSAHRQTQHGVVRGGSGQEGDEETRGDKPRTFRMVFPAKTVLRPCPAERCSDQAETRTDMRVHL